MNYVQGAGSLESKLLFYKNKKPHLFEFPEISSRTKHWDMSYKRDGCCYLLREAISRSSIQNVVSASQIMMGRARAYHFSTG